MAFTRGPPLALFLQQKKSKKKSEKRPKITKGVQKGVLDFEGVHEGGSGDDHSSLTSRTLHTKEDR